MHRRIGAVLLAIAMLAGRSGAQVADSTHRLAFFAGGVGNTGPGTRFTSVLNAEFGGSADFRLRGFPHTLRASLAFRQDDRDWTATPMKFGTLSLDLVGKPIPRIFGMQPYLLGGLGLGTRSDYVAVLRTNYSFEPPSYVVRQMPRNTWLFAEGGIGVELGHRLFVQTKLMVPVASQGPTLMPISVGFRFWD